MSATSFVHEPLVTLDVLGLREVRGQHEVEVPRRSVTGHPAQEAVLGEQHADLVGRLGDPRRRYADVLDDQGRAGRAQPADESVQALAHPPVELDRLLDRG